VSDRTGVRKLYIMDKDGKNFEMITKERGTYDKPSWSPDGRLISFVKIEGKNFSIGLMTPKGESERTIMSAYLVEGVKWSPNGRYLIYSKQNAPFGKESIPGIYIIDILTGVEHRIPTPANQGATDPDWIKK
jgi:Tol biopolymer transport system component